MANRLSIMFRTLLRLGGTSSPKAGLAVLALLAAFPSAVPAAKAKPSPAGKDACQSGRGLYAAGDVLKAITSLEHCLEKDSRNREGWVTLATARLESGRFPEAADAYARAHALRPGDAGFLTSYLDALEGAGRAGERVQVLRALVEAGKEEGRNAEKLLALLDSLGTGSHPDDRLFVLERLSQSPDAPLHHQEKLAATYLARGMLDKSQAEYRGLVSRRPENGEFWAGLAASIAKDDRVAAVECYRKAILYSSQAGLRASYEKESAALKAAEAKLAASKTAPASPSKSSATPEAAPATASKASSTPSAAPGKPIPSEGSAKIASTEPAKPAKAAPAKPFDIKAFQDSIYKVELEKRMSALRKPETGPAAVAAVPAPSLPSVAKADKDKADRERAEAEKVAKAKQEAQAREDQERKAKADKEAQDRKAKAEKEEQDRLAKEAAKKADEEKKLNEKLSKVEKEKQEKLAKEEKQRQDKLAKETEKKAKEDRERFVKDSLSKVELERLAKQEADRKAKEEKDKQDKVAREEKEKQDRLAREARERIMKDSLAKVEQARLAKVEADLKAKEEREKQDKLAREARERIVKDSLVKVEQARLAKVEADRKAKEEKDKQEKLAREEKEKQDRLAREARERFVKDSLAQAEKERLARLEVERKAKEEQERLAREAALRKAEEEKARKLREERERFVRDSLAKVEQERIAKLEEERKAREKRERREQAIALYRTGRLDSADVLFKAVLAESPDPEVFYFAGRVQMDKGRPGKALDLLAKAPKDMPDLDVYMGRAYKATGKPKEALEAFERQFARSQTPEILEEICALRKPAADPAPWAACLEKLLEKRPMVGKYHEELAEHYRKRNDKAKALVHYARLLMLEPAHGEANYQLGMDWSGQGVHDRAVPLLEKAVAAFPERSTALKALAKGQSATGRRDQAWESYKKAAALLPKDADVARGRLALAKDPGRDSALDGAYKDLLKLVPEDGDANMGYAKLRFQARDYAVAEKHFRIGCRDSKDAVAWGQFGRSLLETRKPDEAAPALQKALDLGETSMALRLDLARLHLDKGDADRAETLVKEISAKAPSDPEPYYWLGRIAEKRQQAAVQEEFIRKANQLRPDETRYAEALARLYRDRDEYKQAISVLTKVESRLSSEGRMLLADCLAAGGDGKKALEIYSALFQKEPSAILLSRRIDVMVRTGQAGEAAEAARGTAFGKKPEVQFSVAKAHLSLAESHVLKGDLDQAVSLLKHALDADGHRPDYHFHLGMAYYRKGKIGKATDSFTDALRYRVDYPDAVYWKGMCLVEDGRAIEARNFFGELAQHADLRWKAKGLMGLARVFETEGKWEAVEHHLVKSVGTLPNADAMAYLSRVQLKLGRFPEAEEWARKALELDGSHVEGTLALAEALAARKKIPEALGLAEAALKVKPLSCELMVQTAKLNLEAGRLDSTLISTGKAIQACPQEPMPHFYAAMANRGANRPEDAKRHFKSFKKLGGDKKLIPE